MALSCEEYRCQQELLALKRRLSEINLEPEEREEIERLIQKLERKVKLPAPAYRQEGGASSRLVRENTEKKGGDVRSKTTCRFPRVAVSSVDHLTVS
jgi:hypothetical protein